MVELCTGRISALLQRCKLAATCLVNSLEARRHSSTSHVHPVREYVGWATVGQYTHFSAACCRQRSPKRTPLETRLPQWTAGWRDPSKDERGSRAGENCSLVMQRVCARRYATNQSLQTKPFPCHKRCGVAGDPCCKLVRLSVHSSAEALLARGCS